jgi:hypothetical protein
MFYYGANFWKIGTRMSPFETNLLMFHILELGAVVFHVNQNMIYSIWDLFKPAGQRLRN